MGAIEQMLGPKKGEGAPGADGDAAAMSGDADDGPHDDD